MNWCSLGLPKDKWIMNFNGYRYLTNNGTLVAVHMNPGATPGNRVERYLGHSIPIENKEVELVPLKICWNENGECVWVQGVVDDVKNYDLAVACYTEKDSKYSKIVVKGCRECNELP